MGKLSDETIKNYLNPNAGDSASTEISFNKIESFGFCRKNPEYS